jgi:tricorn protease
MLYRNIIATALVLLAGFAGQASAAGFDIDAAMLRYPAVSDSQIAFSYNNDLWVVPKTGGTASPLSSPAGNEAFPHFSPDGKSIAFTGNYDGNMDVYIMPVEGGIPQRLTWGPAGDICNGFDAQGNVLFANASEMKNYGGGRIYRVSPLGGVPEALPMEYAMFCTMDADNETVAFTPTTREFDTWKRYEGGNAQDIWLLNVKTLASEQITNYPGTDAQPMIRGNVVYFLSDAGSDNRLNLWVYDRTTKQRRQLTTFHDFDCKFPGLGPADIVLENGGTLYRYELAGGALVEVNIRIPGDRPSLMKQTEDVSDRIFGMTPSPNGVRLGVEAMGDIWTIPVKEGIRRNLTMSNDSTERYPVWSPDGKLIAYFSDADGDYQLYLTQSDGRGETRQLTTDDETWFMNPVWSPDSTKIAFADSTGALYIHSIDQQTTFLVDKDPWAFYPYTEVNWSADSAWLAYQRMDAETGNAMIVLYDMLNAWAHVVTAPMFSSVQPCFDMNGDYLYFLTQRNFNHAFGDFDETYVFPHGTMLACVPLRHDVPSPYAGKNDDEEIKAAAAAAEEEAAGDSKVDDKDAEAAGDDDETTDDESGDAEPAADESGEADEAKDAGKDEASGAMLIDIEGFESRAVLMPLPGGDYSNLAAGAGRVFFLDLNQPGGPTIMMLETSEEQPVPVLPGAGGFELLPDGKRMLAYAQGRLAIVNAGPGANMEEAINTGGLMLEYDPHVFWKALVTDAHRMYGYMFYDPDMHGVDWDSIGRRYIAMVNDATSRQDVSWIISEMISELNVGHTYYSGPTEPTRSRNVGLLGANFEYVNDAAGTAGIRIGHILGGGPWDLDARSPIGQPGMDIAEGDFIIAVNGIPLSASQPIDAAMQGLAGETVVLTISDDASVGEDDREVIVTPLGNEYDLRRRDWIEANRRYVDEQSRGQVGYIYVPDTQEEGVNNLMRQLVGQFHKPGLIIDERWNGGGYIPTYFMDILSRKTLSYWARRDGLSYKTPGLAHNGSKVMLINSNAGSGGDAFPYYFRQAGLGKIIGTRTWGGLVGISGQPSLVDGSHPTIPNFGFFELDGTWGIEGYGVDPDIEVIPDPGLLARGQDPQLDAGIAEVLKEMAANPFREPAKPAYPDRSGKGISPQDK